MSNHLSSNATMNASHQGLSELKVLAQGGNRTALARLVSRIERGEEVVAQIGTPGELGLPAHSVVGITGSPGAGKSTLTDKLVATYRAAGDEVAVLAIDPTSPYSGGAILGDRIRMNSHSIDSGVFIRSFATRGHMGGLATAIPETLSLLQIIGFPRVLVETVGVGQVEVEIATQADTTVVVVNPGWGDSIQANKAGLMEIADVFVINKADRDGVRETRRDISAMLELGAHKDWKPPIVETVASNGKGIEDFVGALSDHEEHLRRSGEFERRRQERAVAEFERHLLQLLSQAISHDSETGQLVEEVRVGRVDPRRAARDAFERWSPKG